MGVCFDIVTKKGNASTINIEQHLQDRRNFISKTNSPKKNVGSQNDKEKGDILWLSSLNNLR